MKTALLGHGDWGKLLEKYIEESPFFCLEYIYSRTVKHPKGTCNLDQILQSNVEVVFLALPPNLLTEFSKKCILAKKHLFCEKPLSTNPKEVLELYNMAFTNKVMLHVNYIYLQSPSINYIKDAIHLIGKPQKSFFNIKQFGKFYKNQSAFEVLGCHLLATYFYLFDQADKDIIDVRVMSTESKLSQVVHIQQNSHLSIFHSDLLSPRKERSIQIIGEQGMLYFCPFSEKTVELYLKDKNNTFVLKEAKSFDESNNITNALLFFKNSLNNSTTSYDQKSIVENVSHLLCKTV